MGTTQAKPRAALHAARDPDKLIAFKDLVSCLIDRRVLKAKINDSVNISGTLSMDSLDVNSLTSSDSSQLIVTDNFRVDGYLQANQVIGDIATLGTIASPVNGSQSVNFQLASTADIWIDNTSSIDFTSGSVGARKVIIIHNTAGSNKTVTIQTDGVTKATVTIAAGAANVYELFAVSSADKYVVDVGTLI